ncbi:MAG TPA: ATP-binding protein, partial [Thermomicrobiaceae bacterium]|nr:ATP-binding protein [Thermomicrobiaceae bacterium]
MHPYQVTSETDGMLPAAERVLVGGGEMGARMRAMDWSATPLGPVAGWPQALKTCVRLLLTSRQPMWLGWGPELTYFYNDPYLSIIGGKHPQALGQPTSAVWREIWDDIGPRLHAAMGGEEGTYDEALLLIMERHGYPEETYYTFSYSPIPDDEGRVGGVFCANTDDTQRIIGERQVRLLRELAATAAEARTIDDACRLSARALETNPHDLPFALLYLLEPEQQRAVLAGTAGIVPGHPAAPATLGLDAASPWPLAEVVRTNAVCLVDDLPADAGAVPAGAWDRPPRQAVVLPIASSGETGRAGVLVVGLNPYRLFDGDYRGFLGLVAGQVAAAIGNAQAYAEERKRAEMLAELDRAKTLFFSNVSHEFRTPLTLLLGPLADTLGGAHGDLTPAQRAELDVAQRNALRLLRLVNSLLDFSRLEAGRVQASFAPTELPRLTADLAATFRSAIERAGLRLVVETPPLPEGLAVYVDHEMWEKIVLNLLSNAFKHTFEGEIAVTLNACANGRGVELRVRDTGTGIPAAELPRLFERFHRVQGAQARTHEGTGIGLALVQELVTLHGGTVGVASEPGRGTTFTVTLPAGTAHLPPDRIGAARTVASPATGAAPFVEEALRWLPGDAGAEPDISQSAWHDAGVPQAPASAARVLLADDNADMREYVTRLLAGRYQVEAVPNGAAALEAARERPPDLVLTDVMMPKLDGFGLLRALRADEPTREVPVILLSARAGEEAQVEGLEAGADDYLIKPFSARELLARVEARLEPARSRREKAAVEQQARLAAERERERLNELFMQAPSIMAVLRGPEHVFELVNLGYQQAVGQRDAVGLPVREALPELEAQGFVELLDRVYATGEPFVGAEVPVMLDRLGDGTLEMAYLNFIYQPIREGGQVTGIFAHGVDVTEQVRARERLAADLAATQRLQETSTRLIREEDPQALYEQILDAAVAVMRADFASMQMFYPARGAGGELRLLAHRGFSEEAAAVWERIGPDSESTCAGAMRARERVVVPDIR